MEYPSSLPCPQIDGYAVDTDYGLSRVVFETGHARQRRTNAVEKHIFSLSLVLSMRQVWEWQSWANQYAYDWHYMPLMSKYSGLAEQTLLKHFIRYISDIAFEPVDVQYMRASFQAELDVNTPPISMPTQTGIWYSGGTPAAPSSDIIIGGTPAAPSSDIIIAGSPGFPAA